MTLPTQLTKVTTLSKFLAAFVFITLPFIFFYLGMSINSSNIQPVDNNLTNVTKPTPTAVTVDNANTDFWTAPYPNGWYKDNMPIPSKIGNEVYNKNYELTCIKNIYGDIQAVSSNKLVGSNLIDSLKKLEQQASKVEGYNITNIELSNICSNKDLVYVTFSNANYTSWLNLFINKVQAGGVVKQSFLGVINNTNITIIPLNDSARINIEYKGIRNSIDKIVYYGCNDIISVDNNYVYMACGGGDAGGFARDILKVNTNTNKVEQLIGCTNDSKNFINAQEFSEKDGFSRIVCINTQGEIYFEKLSEL